MKDLVDQGSPDYAAGFEAGKQEITRLREELENLLVRWKGYRNQPDSTGAGHVAWSGAISELRAVLGEETLENPFKNEYGN